MQQSIRGFEKHAILRDGGSIRLRAIRPDDKQRLLDHFAHLGDQSRYFRFHGSKPALSPQELANFTEPDFVNHVGLVATLINAGREEIIGVGRYYRTHAPDGKSRAEAAFAVADEHQLRGIGTLLLEELVHIARDSGIEELEAYVLHENRGMIDVFRACGFAEHETFRDGCIRVSIGSEENEATRAASERRERIGAAASLRAILEPKSVAVVGASRNPESISAAVLSNLVKHGFRGAVYPVNPHATELEGLRCYPNVGAIGAPIDLAVICLPAAQVESAAAECAHAGVRGLVVISAGFAEVSSSGREVQVRLRDSVRASGMRMVGPNCMGVLNTDPKVSLDATFAPIWPAAGNIAMSSQSGALGLALLDYAHERGLGVSSFVSVGNKADISGNDLLCYWADDPRTQVIALYLESFGNSRKFGRIAPLVARKKPIVAVKSGRSEAGKRAAASHSAALASAEVAVDALFEQAGVIRTRTLEEMLDVVALLSSQPFPRGPRVAIVTNAGGPGILVADACEGAKMEVASLAPQSIEQMRAYLPREAGLANPIDMIASASPRDYERTLEIAGADPNIDALIAIYIPPRVSDPKEIAAAVARGAGKVPAEKPVLAVFISSEGAPEELYSGPRGKLPAYSFPENAALALSAAFRHGEWLRRPTGEIFRFDRESELEIRRIVDLSSGSGWLAPREIRALLAAAKIPLAEAAVVPSAEAGAAAEKLGFPLVAKAIAKNIVHKSDLGLVITALESRAEVEDAVRQIEERGAAHGAELDGILLQRYVEGGLEMIVGVSSDAMFGPLVVCGLGGTETEILGDTSFRLTPVSDVDATEMIAKLRAKKLLDGYRGSPRRDQRALEEIILRVSALVDLVPELVELDLNPVVVLREGKGAVAVDARVRIQAATSAAFFAK